MKSSFHLPFYEGKIALTLKHQKDISPKRKPSFFHTSKGDATPQLRGKREGRGANFLPRHVHLPFLISRLRLQQSRHLFPFLRLFLRSCPGSLTLQVPSWILYSFHSFIHQLNKDPQLLTMLLVTNN